MPHQIYNIGNNKPEKLLYFIDTLEELPGKKALREYLPVQPGDVPATYADISKINRDYGFHRRRIYLRAFRLLHLGIIQILDYNPA